MSSSDIAASTSARTDKLVRVLFVNTRSALGADVAVHLTLIRNFDPERVDVFVATNSNSRDLDITLKQLDALPAKRLTVRDLGHEMSSAGGGVMGKIRGATRNFAAIATLLDLARMIRRNRIDLLHSTDRPRDALFTTILACMTGCRTVVHVHINWNEHFGKATRWALSRCTGILTISNFSRESYVQGGDFASKLYMSYNATDTVHFDPASTPRGRFRTRLGLSPDTPLIGIVARIMIWKGHLELVEALAKVRDAVPDVQLAIVGEETGMASESTMGFADQLRARIDTLGLAKHVHWVGWCDDMPQVMRDLDILAMPSWEEPFGLAVTEALAMETPVVGFASGALPEIITSGEEGLLTPPKDVDALASALIELLRDPAARRRMGVKGRERVKSAFSPRRQADEVSKIYHELVVDIDK